MRGYAAHTLGYAPHTLGYAGLLQVRVFTCNPLHNHFYPQRRPQYHHARSQQDFRRPRGRRGPMGHGRQGRSPTSPAPSAPTIGSPSRRTSTRPTSSTLGLAKSPPPAPSLGQCVMFRGVALPLNTFGGGYLPGAWAGDSRAVGGGGGTHGQGQGTAHMAEYETHLRSRVWVRVGFRSGTGRDRRKEER